jgi:hypothetical protein
MGDRSKVSLWPWSYKKCQQKHALDLKYNVPKVNTRIKHRHAVKTYDNREYLLK